MSRHRNIRSKNYDDDYYDEDEYSGHSVEDSFCISPGTAAQFTFNRDKSLALSNYMGEEEDIPEENEGVIDETDDQGLPSEKHRGSLDYFRPNMNALDEAKLNSCLEEVRNVLGEIVPEPLMVDAILRHNFSIESSLNELLNQQEVPKPQRIPRENRRNRSQGGQISSLDSNSQNIDSVSVTCPTVTLPEPSKLKNSKTVVTSDQSEKDKCMSSVSKISEPISQSFPLQTSPNKTVSKKAVKDPEPDLSDTLKISKLNVPVTNITVIDTSENLIENVKNAEISERNKIENAALSDKLDDGNVLSTPKKERFIPPLPRSSSKAKFEKYDLQEEFKNRNKGKDLLNLVVIGHVDAGKSTLMGHVLYQLGNVNQRVMHKYEQESKKVGKSSFAFAWVLDETEEERVRGVTMDIGQTKFETPAKIITLLDAPGHKDFIPNMITGTAQADAAILVVNATKGEFETGFESGGQTREHAILARSLGVSQLIVAVNKMDTVGWDQARYNDIVLKLGQFLKQAGFREADTFYIPVSGLAGENLTHPAQDPQLKGWYKGNNLLEQIDKFKPVIRPVDKPLRLSVSDIFKGLGGGFTVAGKVVSGGVQLGDKVIVMPAAELAFVKGITINDEAVNFAFAGDHVSVIVTGIDLTHIGVGSVLCDPSSPVKCATKLLAKIVLLNLEIPVTRGFTVIFHYQTVSEPAIVTRLVSQLNKSTGEVVKNKPKCLTKNSSAIIELEFEFPMCVELYKDNKDLGRFMLRYNGHTIAAGLIDEVLKTKTGIFATDQGAAVSVN